MLTRYCSTRFAFASVAEWLLQSKAFCLETSMRLCWEASYSRGARSSAWLVLFVSYKHFTQG